MDTLDIVTMSTYALEMMNWGLLITVSINYKYETWYDEQVIINSATRVDEF